MAKKEEKVVEEVQSTEIKNDQPSNKIAETKAKESVEKEGGNMKVAAKTKKVTNTKDLEKIASICLTFRDKGVVAFNYFKGKTHRYINNY